MLFAIGYYVAINGINTADSQKPYLDLESSYYVTS